MKIVGLDIGGATLKAATADGQAISARFALWKHPEQLAEALANLLEGFDFDALAVTMTGELCDCFETRRDGVRAIKGDILIFCDQALRNGRRKSSMSPLFWHVEGGLVGPGEAVGSHIDLVQAANWHALATYAARWTDGKPALLIDIGSTTTDIIPIVNGKPAAAGKSDAERLASGELNYFGVERTPLCAFLPKVEIAGRKYRTMAEWFATSRDVFLVTGDLEEDATDCETANGRPATVEHAVNRLARTIGKDRESFSLANAKEMSHQAIEKIVATACEAISEVLPRMSQPPQVLLFSGHGEFLARRIANAIPTLRRCQQISIADKLGPEASKAACAVAVANLLETWLAEPGPTTVIQ